MSRRPQVVVTRPLADDGEARRLAAAADVTTLSAGASLGEALREADGLIAVWPRPVQRADLVGADRLRVIATVTAGSDHVDTVAAAERGIAVVTGVGAAPEAVAEYALWAALGLRRDFFGQAARMGSADFAWPGRFAAARSRQAGGATWGVVGLGHIGSLVAQLASGLGMSVAYHDPGVNEASWSELDLGELFERSDIVSLHLPLTATTRGLVGARLLELLGPSGVLVDVSRGGVVDESALLDAARHGVIGGAAIDVFDAEPPSPELVAALVATGRVVVTPHVAGFSAEAARALAGRAVDAVLAIFD